MSGVGLTEDNGRRLTEEQVAQLRAALLDAKVASAELIDEAIARQQLYGADIITNLLELTNVDEATAVKALSSLFKMEAAPIGELPYASAAALELVPRETARALGIYPFRLTDTALTVVVSEPLDRQAEADLGFSLKVETKVLFALAPRIRQATARDYAFALDRRTSKAVAKLSNAGSSSLPPPVVALNAPSFSQFPRPRSSPPFGFPDQWSDAVTPSSSLLLAETARQPTVSAGSLTANDGPPQASRSLLTGNSSSEDLPPPSRPRRRGPYGLNEVQADLDVAKHPSEVLGCYFDFAAQFFDFAAILVVSPNLAEVKRVQGHNVTALDVIGQQLALADFPCLAQVQQQGQWILAPLASQEPTLAQLLDRTGPHESLLLPVKVRDRVKLILVGSFDDEPVALGHIGELLAVEPLVALALETVIMRRKGISKPPDLAKVKATQPMRNKPPRKEQRAEAFKDAVENSFDKR